jgi:hypothetical protein
MPITIDGSGTIGGINTGGLPDGCIATADLANNAVTYAKIGTTEQSQVCKAWVNFNGTGVVAIRANYNVSSITDNGVGDYTLNFTSALPDGNYAVKGSCQMAGVVASLNMDLLSAATMLAGSCRFRLSGGNSLSDGIFDSPVVCVAIFR